MTMKKVTRQLKINREVRETGRTYYKKTKLIPSLKLSGNWFQEAGFDIGQNVEIEVKKGKLILKALD